MLPTGTEGDLAPAWLVADHRPPIGADYWTLAHCSTSVLNAPSVGVESPTATQYEDPWQVMALNSALPTGLGLLTHDHRVPFHFAMNVLSYCGGLLKKLEPATKHDIELEHQTPLATAERRRRPGRIDQVVPCQASIRFWLELPEFPPTAKHDPEAHETELNKLLDPMLGLATVDQVLPFHSAIKVWLS